MPEALCKLHVCNDADETRALGADIGRALQPGDVIALYGEMGAGKTVMVQGIAKGLGIEAVVNSPTFTIMQLYRGGRLPLCHFDLFRLSDPTELDEIGMDEFIRGDGVCVIEWADLFPEVLPERHLDIRIERDPLSGDDVRRIRVTSV